MSAVSVRERLQDILDAISAIERHTSEGRSQFDTDERVRALCERRIEIIGEAATKLPADLRLANADVPWREIIAMRNFLIHGYRDVEDREVWSVVEHDLPILRAAIERMLAELPPD